MKNLYRSFLLFFSLMFSVTVMQAQNFSVGVAASAGFSYIGSDDSCPDSNVGDVKRFSGNLGFYIEQQIKKDISIGLMASLVQIKGGERMWNIPTQIIDDENNTQTFTTTYQSAIRSNYLALPLYLRKGNERGAIKLGLTPMFFLGADSDISEFLPQIDTERVLRKMDLGASVGFDWNLTSLLGVSLEYYHGMRDIELSTDSHRRFNSQLMMGLRYVLYR